MTHTARHFTPTKGTLVALLLVSMLNCMGGAAVAPALPQISAAFPEAPESMVALIISLPSLSVAISGFFVGAIADKVGKAKTLAVSLVLFTAAGLSGVVLPTLEMILVSRFVMGIGMAGVATASTALIADYYDIDQQAKVLGMQSAATGASILVLEMLGGFLALAGWRVPFYVYLVGVVMFVCVVLYVREPYGKGAKHEEPGVAGADGQEAAPERPMPSAKSIGAVIVLCLALAFFTTTVSFLIPSKMPYLVDQFGGNTAISGLLLGAFGLANIISSLLYSRLVRRFGRYILLGVGWLFIAAGMLCLGLANNLWMILPGVVLVNFGVGFILPLLVNWIAWVSTPQNSGRLMGLNSTLINLGQFFSPFWSGVILAQTGSYGPVFIGAAVIGIVVTVVIIVISRVAPGLQNIQVR